MSRSASIYMHNSHFTNPEAVSSSKSETEVLLQFAEKVSSRVDQGFSPSAISVYQFLTPIFTDWIRKRNTNVV